jgi:hypothetical protein
MAERALLIDRQPVYTKHNQPHGEPSFRREQRVEHSFFLSPDWLKQEVIKEKQKPIKAGETPWYFLAGTGFFIKEQVAQLMQNVPSMDSSIFQDVVNIELGKVKVDIESFEDEYLRQLLSLRFNVAWDNEKVVCTDYNNITWESITGKNEREGAVYQSLFGEDGKGGVQEWLKNAPPDSFAIIVSPEGWSGLYDAKGDEITFPESQIYALRTTENGGLEEYTLRYKADITENIAFQQSLGLQPPKYHNQKELIKDVLKNVVYVRGDDANRNITSFEDIVDEMQKSVKGRDIAYEGKSFHEIKRFLKNPKLFEERSLLTDPLIERFQTYARWQLMLNSDKEDIEKNLQIALAITITNLNDLYDEQEKLKQGTMHETNSTTETHYLSDKHQQMAAVAFMQRGGSIDYQKSHEKLQEKPGCAGGGNKTKVNSMGMSRNAETSVTGSSDICAKIRCRQCGWEPSEGETVGSECPTCGWAPGKPVKDINAKEEKDQDKPQKIENKGDKENKKQPEKPKEQKKEEFKKEQQKPKFEIVEPIQKVSAKV